MSHSRHYDPFMGHTLTFEDLPAGDEKEKPTPRARILQRAAQVCMQYAQSDLPPPKDFQEVSDNGPSWYTKDLETVKEVEEILTRCILLNDKRRAPRMLSFFAWPVLTAVYVVSAFIETPSWCVAESIDAPIWDDCGDRSVTPRSSMSAMIGAVQMRIVHTTCLLGFTLMCMLDQHARLGWSSMTPWSWLCFTSLFVGLLLSVTGIILDVLRAPSWLVRSTAWLSVLCRPVVLLGINVFRVQLTAERICMAARAAIPSICLMASAVLTYAWIGIILFAFCSEGANFMNSPHAAALTMFITMTTANFPTVMMDIYSQYRLACLFFISFLVLNLYILQNVILAEVSHGFKEKYRDSLTEDRQNRSRCAEVAFGLLAEPQPDENGEHYVLLRKVQELAQLHYVSTGLGEDSATELAEGLVSEESLIGNVNLHDFVAFCAKLRQNFASGRDAAPHGNLPAWESSLERAAIIEDFVDVVLVVMLLLAAVQTVMILEVQSVDETDKFLSNLMQVQCGDAKSCFWPAINTFVSVASLGFLLELAWKVYTFGFYWFLRIAPLRNPLDLCLVPVLCFAEVQATLFKDMTLLGPRLPMVLRLVRGAVRLSLRVHPWRVLFRSLQLLLHIFKGLFAFVGVWFLLFASIGTHVFGGRIRYDNKLLKDTGYATAAGGVGYYANNFNDIPSAIVTLFELMVINDWWVLMGGFAAVLPEADWFAWMFAIIFWAGTCLFVLNVCTGMVVQSLFSIRMTRHSELSSYFLAIDSEHSQGGLNRSLRHHSTQNLDQLRDELLDDVLR